MLNGFIPSLRGPKEGSMDSAVQQTSGKQVSSSGNGHAVPPFKGCWVGTYDLLFVNGG